MKNIGLLTKEAVNQFKSKWMLFLFYLLFLIISIAIIIGLIHFTYSFGHDAKKYDTLDRVSSLYIRAPKISEDDEVKKDGPYYSFVSDQVNELEKTADVDKNKEIEYIISNRGNVPVSDDEKSLFENTKDCMHNLFVKWLMNDSDLKNAFSSSKDILFRIDDSPMNLGILDNKKMTLSMTDVRKTDLTIPDNLVYEWQTRSDNGRRVNTIIDKVDDFSIDNFDPIKNANDVMVTPAFLKFNHYKLGEKKTLLYNGKPYEIRFAATSINPGQTVSNKTNLITLNPVLYNKIFERNYKPIAPVAAVVNFSVGERDAKTFNKICAENYETAKSILSKSLSNSAVKSSVEKVNFSLTAVHSYEMQLMLYNLISWIVSVILIILLVSAYRFIQGLIINDDKPVLVNLKALGVNEHEIGYYLSISFLPTLFLGSGIGLGFAELVYYLMTRTLGRAVSFTMGTAPRSVLGYLIFAGIFVGLIVVGGLMAWMSTRGKKLSIHAKTKLSKTEMLLLNIKNIKPFRNNGFSNVIYSFQISNLLKAFSTFIVTILSLTVLGVTLQFLVSIGAALNDKPYIYNGSGESLSYREYGNHQIENTNKSMSDYYKLQNKVELKYDDSLDKGNPYKSIERWLNGYAKDPQNLKDPNGNIIKMYDRYFDDVKEVNDFYEANKTGLDDNKNKSTSIDIGTTGSFHIEGKDIEQGLEQLNNFIGTYQAEFGKNEPLPKIFFRDRPKTDQFVSWEEMHMGISPSYNKPIAFFNNDETFTKRKLKANEIIINNFIAKSFNTKLGGALDIKFSGVSAIDTVNGKTSDKNNNVSNDELTMKVVGITDKFYNQAEALVNFDAIRKANAHNEMDNTSEINGVSEYINGVVSKSAVPYDIQNFVIPVGRNWNEKEDSIDEFGKLVSDYFPIALNKQLATDVSFSSLPIIHNFYMQKTEEFRSFAQILSVLLILVCLCVVVVISILIAYENKKNILVLKTLGYSVEKTISLFSIIYSLFIGIGFLASIFIAGTLIDSFTGTLISRLGLALVHQYVAETIIVPFIIAAVFLLAIIGIVIYSYKKAKVQDATFAE